MALLKDPIAKFQKLPQEGVECEDVPTPEVRSSRQPSFYQCMKEWKDFYLFLATSLGFLCLNGVFVAYIYQLSPAEPHIDL